MPLQRKLIQPLTLNRDIFAPINNPYLFCLGFSLTAAGYLCYLRSVHRIIDESHRLPWRDELLKMSPQRLSIVVLLVFVTVVLLKAYCIRIVWRCYKYLTMRQHNLRSMLPYIIPEVAARQVGVKDRLLFEVFVINRMCYSSSNRNVTTTHCCRTTRKPLPRA